VRTVLSLCHPRKPGLLDHAQTIVRYGRMFDPDARYKLVSRFGDLTKWRGGGTVVVIWDNSPASLALAWVLKLRGAKIVYYLHEPGGLGQKLVKDDPLVYSFLAAYAELCFRGVADLVAVPRFDRMAHGDVFLPLPFWEERPDPVPGANRIGFIGARRRHRLQHVFAALEPVIRAEGFVPAYFPAPDGGAAEADKLAFLAGCAAVWNPYGVPLNQSGVTLDAAMSSIPVIGTAFEPFRDILKRFGLFYELRLSEGPESLADQLRVILLRLAAKSDRKPVEAAARSELAGAAMFQRRWLPFLQSV
jgi:hypothetical protein